MPSRPAVAHARLALTKLAPEPDSLAALAVADPKCRPLATLAAGRGNALAADGLDPNGSDPMAATAALFNRLAIEAPEAAAAFYSLSDARLLATATGELVERDRAVGGHC